MLEKLCLFTLALGGSTIYDDVKARFTDKLTLDEKLAFFGGVDGEGYVGQIPGVPRMAIPPVRMNDAGQGFRTGDGLPASSTCYPSSLAIASTFDRGLGKAFATFVAAEFRGKGSNNLLGPGVNLHRVPRNGRNFEYVSGEDPYLGSEMVRGYIEGALAMRVMPCVKHFIANNQETNRTTTSSDVNEHTLMNFYMRPFIAAIEAGASSVMCSYNRVNSTYACENEFTLRWLKSRSDRFFIMSDWGATHSTTKAIRSGLDVEMPTANYFKAEKLRAALNAGEISTSDIDDTVTRILTALTESGQFEKNGFPASGSLANNVTNRLHKNAAKLFAMDSMILLKNLNNALPLQSHEGLATFHCGSEFLVRGLGSGHVDPTENISVEDALGETPSPKSVAIVCLSDFSSENMDRPDLQVKPTNVDWQGLRLQYKKIIVLVSTPGVFVAPWIAHVDGVIVSAFPGEQAGPAYREVLYGRYNPSGRLPFTIPNTENEQEMSVNQYPGVHDHSEYSEEAYFGYRWYMKHGVKPLFSFGFGMNYNADKIFISNALWAKEARRVNFCIENGAPRDETEALTSANALVEDYMRSVQEHSEVQPDHAAYDTVSPSPVVFLFAKHPNRDFLELVEFRKIRSLTAGRRACISFHYDIPTIWDAQQQRYVDWPHYHDVFIGLNLESLEKVEPTGRPESEYGTELIFT